MSLAVIGLPLAVLRPASSHPGGGPRRVLNGVRWRLKKLVRVSKRAVAHRRKSGPA